MKKLVPILVLLSLVSLLSLTTVTATECGSRPSNNCVISQSTTLTPGTYSATNITFVADNVQLDCNGAILQGVVGESLPTVYVGGVSGNTITNCHFKTYSAAISNLLENPIPEPVGYFTITDNIFETQTSGNAIQFEEQLAPNRTRSRTTQHTITGNTITGLHNIGIILHNANRSIIASNDIDLNAPNKQAIYIVGGSYSTIRGNTIHTGNIILQRFGLGTALNNTLQRNTIKNARTAIEILEGTGNTMVLNNTITVRSIGVYLRGSNVTITRNRFNGTGISVSAEGGGSFVTFGAGGSTNGIVLEQATTPKHNLIALNTFENIDDPISDGGENNKYSMKATIPEIAPEEKEYGNFYSIFSNANHYNWKGEPCSNINDPNMCDNPYIFFGNEDKHALRFILNPNLSSPVVDPIAEIMIKESEQAIIQINATGVTSLTYSVSSPQYGVMPNEPNQFMWQTNFNHAGSYLTNVSVINTYNVEVRKEVRVTVAEANDDCSLYIPRIANGCAVKNDITFVPGTQFVPDGIRIEADDVVVNCGGAEFYGDTLANKYGITIDKQDSVTIKDCNIKKFYIGLNLTDSSNNLIENVQSVENREGVAANFGNNGLELTNSHNNIIRNSNFSANGDTGIRIFSSNNNIIDNNEINSNENRAGISLSVGSNNNTIINNRLIDNDNGGIDIVASNNFIINNTIERTRQNYGIHLIRGNNNIIYHNNLINNRGQVREVFGQTGNQWSFNNKGNYYSEHFCIGNYFCNDPYVILASPRIQDDYPYREENGWHYPEPHVVANPTVPLGQPTTINLAAGKKYAGQVYVFALALGSSTGIPLLENKKIYLDNDVIFRLSLSSPLAFGIQNYVGVVDQDGNAQVAWTPPTNVPLMRGITFHVGGVIIDTNTPGLNITGIYVPTQIQVV